MVYVNVSRQESTDAKLPLLSSISVDVYIDAVSADLDNVAGTAQEKPEASDQTIRIECTSSWGGSY